MFHNRQLSFFEEQRASLEWSVELSVAALRELWHYPNWAVAYSGGKDSTATVILICWAIRTGQIRPPESLTILYADTRMELPPLQHIALLLLETLRDQGFSTQVVTPKMDDRLFVYMLGRGVPPPKNRFRWCTAQIKIKPMHATLQDLRERSGDKLLMITGVRLGESAARDRKISLSCSRDSGECGQGWMQVSTPEALADTYAPLLHWRLCHVYDWLYFNQRIHGYEVSGIADVYGEEEVRTGCVGCNLASRDTALERLIRKPTWQHLHPLLELKPLYRELAKSKWRKRKAEPEMRKNGLFSKNIQRMGPLTMEARVYGLERVLDIQRRAEIDLVTVKEGARIQELWSLNTWPERWSDCDVDASLPIDHLSLENGKIVKQALLIR